MALHTTRPQGQHGSSDDERAPYDKLDTQRGACASARAVAGSARAHLSHQGPAQSDLCCRAPRTAGIGACPSPPFPSKSGSAAPLELSTKEGDAATSTPKRAVDARSLGNAARRSQCRQGVSVRAVMAAFDAETARSTTMATRSPHRHRTSRVPKTDIGRPSSSGVQSRCPCPYEPTSA